MVKEVQYVSIKRVLDNLMDHPLLRDLTLEQVVRHTIRFIGLHGYSKLYQDKVEDVEIEDFRGLLPCDLISIIQVKDLRTGVCLRAMTDSFARAQIPNKEHMVPNRDLLHNIPHEWPKHHHRSWYIPPALRYVEEPTFKTQGRVLYVNFPFGKVGVSYKSIPVDEDGFPLLIDNENYLAALEAYIKKQVFTVKFDTGKIAGPILQNAQKDYAFLAAELNSEFTAPSVSEMEALTRCINTMIPKVREFDNGFRDLGNREYLRRH